MGEHEPPSILYVGHGTTVVDMDGVRLLTDPLLRNRVAHLRRTGAVPADALRGLDAVLISHLHYDHLDFGSLDRLDHGLPVIVPRGAGALVRRKGHRRDVVEIAAGEEISVGTVRVRATPAEHDAGRLPFGIRADPVGYLIEGERRVYFAGDTDVFPGMEAIGPVDVALVPIWGWGPSLGPGHMDPAGAAKSLSLLRARVAIPIHWGTYYPLHHVAIGRPDWLRTPPEEFAREATKVAPATTLRVLQPGESTSI